MQTNEIYRSRQLLFYWLPLFVFWMFWMIFLGEDNIITIFQSYWQSSITMIGGSFVAGATPLGGGAVAFPVFTKLLHVSSEDARVFSLFIQSIGMSFATLFFISRKTYINWKIIRNAGIGSFIALPAGLMLFSVDDVVARFIFSEFIMFCAFIMYWNNKYTTDKFRSLFSIEVFIGVIGGLLTSKIGSGCDAILFFYMVFICRSCAKNSIPTVVCFMAINSIYASLLILSSSDQSEFVVGSWWASAPVVSIGAPLGAYVLSKIDKAKTVLLVNFVISLEVLSSLLFSSFSVVSKAIILLTFIMLLVVTFREKIWSLRILQRKRIINEVDS